MEKGSIKSSENARKPAKYLVCDKYRLLRVCHCQERCEGEMRTVISAAVIFLLAGCTTVASIPGHQQVQGPAIKASGGAFSASYSGSWTARNFPCQEPPIPGSFTFNGTGSGSFIHMSGEHLFFIGCTVPWGGTATLTSSRFPRSSISATVDHVLGRSNPCNAFGKHVDFTSTLR